ncbi:MAG: actin family protein [archaeon]|nr:actin family protein [archaeon]
MNLSDTQSNIVIDNGSGYIKVGFSSEEAPKSIFANVYSPSTGKIGDESNEDIIYPVSHGIIMDFDIMEKVFKYLFDDILKVNSEQRQVLISEAPFSPKINKEKLTQLFFEKFNVQGLYVSLQGLLSLYSVGKTTGLVVDSGDDMTCTIPIIEGYSMPHNIIKRNFGGRALTNFLIEMLKQKGMEFKTYEDKKRVKELKEKTLSMLPLESNLNEDGSQEKNEDDMQIENEGEERQNNFDVNMIPDLGNTSFVLPDGTKIDLNKSMQICHEVSFQPDLMGIEIPGIHYQVYDSILKCESSYRKDLFSNIILSGGNTLSSNYPQRLMQEVQKLAPSSLLEKIRVLAHPERKYSTWNGGAILAGLGSFQYIWVKREDYQEAGPQIIHRKC